jgi:hypothetical protein
MTDYYLPEDELPEDISYEDFDDVIYTDDEEFTPIDLDALDDALPAETGPAAPEVPLDQATSDLLDTLDDALPPIRRPAVVPPPRAAVSVVPSAPQQPPSPAARPPVIVRRAEQTAPAVPARQAQPPAALEEAPKPVTLGYQVLIGLPPELGALVLELRATGHIEDMPPPGLCLTPRFHTPDPEALDAALERWAQQHLPLSLEISGVQAEVVGAQQYVAAWYVQPQDRLRQVLATLKKALGGLVRPLPGEPTAVRLRITIGDHIAARRYPYVIAQMQRDFEPTFWHAQTLVLASWSAPAEWDIVATYPGAPPRPTL